MPIFTCEDLMLLSFFIYIIVNWVCLDFVGGFCSPESFKKNKNSSKLKKPVTYVENMCKMRKKKLHYRNKH